jgi:hypothetical protein
MTALEAGYCRRSTWSWKNQRSNQDRRLGGAPESEARGGGKDD